MGRNPTPDKLTERVKRRQLQDEIKIREWARRDRSSLSLANNGYTPSTSEVMRRPSMRQHRRLSPNNRTNKGKLYCVYSISRHNVISLPGYYNSVGKRQAMQMTTNDLSGQEDLRCPQVASGVALHGTWPSYPPEWRLGMFSIVIVVDLSDRKGRSLYLAFPRFCINRPEDLPRYCRALLIWRMWTT